jgi:hypothetical protein
LEPTVIDLRSRLEEMAGPHSTTSTAQVRADLARGRRALRRRRAGQLVAGAAVAVAAGTTAFALASPGAAPVQRVNPPAAQGATQLVAYQGPQPEGYTLDKVPEGWEVQGVNAYALTLAPKGIADRNPNSFVGKIAIMLQSDDDHATPNGTPIQVGDKSGVLVVDRSQPDPKRPVRASNPPVGGATMLYVKQPSGVYLIVQVWDGLGWGPKEIVQFATGVHVHPDAKRGHG